MPDSPNPISIPTESTSPIKSSLYYLLFLVLLPLFGLLTFYGLLAYYRANPDLTPPEVLKSFVNDPEPITDTNESALPTSSPPTVATPTPTPAPLPPGPGSYRVSQGNHQGPTIALVTFKPLDVQQGETLQLEVQVIASSPTDSLIGILKTDNGQVELTFEPASTDADYQYWTTSLTLSDSVLYRYILTLSSKNSEGSSSVTVAPRASN